MSGGPICLQIGFIHADQTRQAYGPDATKFSGPIPPWPDTSVSGFIGMGPPGVTPDLIRGPADAGLTSDWF